MVIVTPTGMAVADPNHAGTNHAGTDDQVGDGDTRSRRNPAQQVEEPAKVMRVASMVKQLLEEVRGAPLDEAGRRRLAEIHRRSLTELERGLSPDLIEELERISLPFDTEAPSEAELRIAQAQLVGWLEGLFHGIQTAIMAQQAAAQQQLQHLRRALPGPGQPAPGEPGARPGGTGQYL